MDRFEAVEKTRVFMENLVKLMVDMPEMARATSTHGENTSVITLCCDKSDIGKLIGKQGRNAQALRTVLAMLTLKGKNKIVLEIGD